MHLPLNSKFCSLWTSISLLSLRQDFLSIKECWFLNCRLEYYFTYLFPGSITIKESSYEQISPSSCPGAWLLALVPQCWKHLRGCTWKKQIRKNFLMLLLFWLGGLFLTQVSSLWLTASPHLQLCLHIKGKDDCKGKWNCCSASAPHLPPRSRLDSDIVVFLWRDMQHVIPIGKWRRFVITIVIPHFLFVGLVFFFLHFTSFGDRFTHNLTLYNTLTKQISFQGILTDHTFSYSWRKQHDKYLQKNSDIASQQQGDNRQHDRIAPSSMSQHPTQ